MNLPNGDAITMFVDAGGNPSGDGGSAGIHQIPGYGARAMDEVSKNQAASNFS